MKIFHEPWTINPKYYYYNHNYYILLHITMIIINPLSARIFTDFGLLVIRGQSVTQGSMGRDFPRYPPRDPGL